MQTNSDKLSVVMSVYNDEKYLEEAIQSTLNQTYPYFKFIIINDGSTDSTREILEEYKKKDNRIRILHEPHENLPASLNKGIRYSKSTYIARMDANDINKKDRLEKQIGFLEKNSSIGIVGSNVELISDTSNKVIEKTCRSNNPALTLWKLLFDNCMLHPTFMMRRSVLDLVGFYDKNFPCAQDYELLARAALKTGITNIEEPLLKLRISGTGLTATHKLEQREKALEISQFLISKITGFKYSIEDLRNLRKLRIGLPIENMEEIKILAIIIESMRSKFSESIPHDIMALEEIRREVSCWFSSLAYWAVRHSFSSGIYYYREAISYNSKIFLQDVFLRAPRRFLRQSLNKTIT